MTVRVLEGHVLDVLRSLPSDTFQCVTTSPPYYGLRDYGLPPQVWGGEAEHEHAWRTANTRKYGNLNEGFNHRWNPNWAEGGKQDHARPREVSTGAFCPCGAWLGSLGLEPTPELYVEHLVSVFREVRRVLRPDGCIFVNLGDSYAGSGKGPNTGNSLANGRGDSVPQEVRQGFVGVKVDTPPGCKPKDLLGMPWMVAFALRADGWYLRAEIIWSKPNPMPESVQGSRWERHTVTLEEYENLSRLRSAERVYSNGAADVSAVSQGEVRDCQSSLPEQRKGQGDGKSARAAPRHTGEASPILSIGAGQGEQSEILPNAERPGHAVAQRRELPDSATSGRGRGQRSGLAGDSGSAQASLSLLWEAQDAADAGSRDPTEQGWAELSREHRAGLPFVQLEEEEQADPSLLVPCPGCPRCEKNDGYILRMAAGRPTKAHEYVFLLTKSGSYHYDSDAIREEGAEPDRVRLDRIGGANGHSVRHSPGALVGPSPTRNKRSVWTVATAPFREAHFATWPPKLVGPMLLAGTSEKGCCPECGAPWERVTSTEYVKSPVHGPGSVVGRHYETGANGWGGSGMPRLNKEVTTTGWRPTCAHDAAPVPCQVLDPFGGAGTTGLVADRLGRDCTLIELNPEYAQMARDRITGDSPLFAGVVA